MWGASPDASELERVNLLTLTHEDLTTSAESLGLRTQTGGTTIAVRTAVRFTRLAPCALGLGLLVLPFTAAADPSLQHTAMDEHPLHRLVERERGPGRFIAEAIAHTFSANKVVRPPGFGDGNSPLDCQHATHDIAFDPTTGVTTATLELRVKAKNGPLSRIGLSLDQGLVLSNVTVDGGRTTTVSDQIYKPARIVDIKISPPIEVGQTAIVRVPYAGTLDCGTYPEGGGVVCTKGEDFSYFAHQSIVPYVFDPLDPTGGSDLDAMTRDIVLRVPSTTDVIATGEKVAETTDGETKISTWAIDRPLSRTLGMYVFAGRLGLRTVPGRNVPTTFVFPNPEMPVDKRLVSWSTPALDFVEKIGGQLLPFQRSMTLVRLPATVGDPGTATFGMTLLSETYQRTGDLMHEETWAHENSHLFWGIVVPESTSFESRMMTEGLATLSEIDYTFGRHFSSEDRDTYLARRFVPIGLDLRVQGKDLPSVQLVNGDSPPDGYRSSLYTLWAYYKSSAVLEHLRATLGDEKFNQSLGEYVKKCSYIGCSPTDFRAVLEKTTGRDLGSFWDRWVTASARPSVTVGFEPVQGGADLELTKSDDAPMTLEIVLGLDDGQVVKRRVDLAGKTTKLHVGTGAWVRTVRTSARHDLMIDARSARELDLDFDGENDGIDLLRCTPFVGKKYESKSATGLWDVEERFDPRCDINGDMVIDDADIDAIAQHYGTLRGAP